MSLESWRRISAEEHSSIFERFGGSFAVHLRKVTVFAN
jgi:hypothetical protein